MTNFSSLSGSSLRTQGPITPGRKSEERPLLQRRDESPRRMGPCVRRDDSLIRHAYENPYAIPLREGVTQYAAASRFYRKCSGILDHPLSRVMTGVYRRTVDPGSSAELWPATASFAEISAVCAGVPQLGASLPSPHARGR